MLSNIQKYMVKPFPYQPGTSTLWDDEYISKGMLVAHLDPDSDAATRNHAFVRRSVQWIATIAPIEKYHALLDLGCGPGIYAELFDEAGYMVAGVDLSPRSIEYARHSAQTHNRKIRYHVCNYLDLPGPAQFDVVTLINYDFGVLSTEDRAKLLTKICSVLRPGGLLIFDVFTPLNFAEIDEYKQWEYSDGGFFSPSPHLLLNSFYRYDQQNTFLRQHLVITEHDVTCFNVWEHAFTESELTYDLNLAGFRIKGLYGDICGKSRPLEVKELCVIAEKHID